MAWLILALAAGSSWAGHLDKCIGAVLRNSERNTELVSKGQVSGLDARKLQTGESVSLGNGRVAFGMRGGKAIVADVTTDYATCVVGRCQTIAQLPRRDRLEAILKIDCESLSLVGSTTPTKTTPSAVVDDKPFARPVPEGAALWGVVEIGGSGVKGLIVGILDAGEEVKIFDAKTIDPQEADSFDSANVELVALSVRDMVERIQANGVDPSRIIAVGSSGVAGLSHSPTLKIRVDQLLADLHMEPLGFVSAREEATLGFDGAVNCVRLSHRRAQVLVIDVGSANTKGAFIPESGGACGSERHQFFELPFGSKRLAQEVDTLGLEDGLERTRVARLGPRFADLATQIPQLKTHPRIYLAGGISWAVATMANPSNRDRYVPLPLDAVRSFRMQLKEDPTCLTDSLKVLESNPECTHLDVNFSTVRDNVQRALVTDDHERMTTEVFTLDQFKAGVEILDTIGEEWELEHRTMFFARPARVAWVLGYLLKSRSLDQVIGSVAPPQ